MVKDKDFKSKSIRFPMELHERIMAIAKQDDRTFSNQVIVLCRGRMSDLTGALWPDAPKKIAKAKQDAQTQ